MPKFRKKPVVIEAVRWSGERLELDDDSREWVRQAINVDPATAGNLFRRGDEIEVWTLEGVMIASPGDWIVRGVQGELYPVKPDIFAATYEPAA